MHLDQVQGSSLESRYIPVTRIKPGPLQSKGQPTEPNRHLYVLLNSHYGQNSLDRKNSKQLYSTIEFMTHLPSLIPHLTFIVP